jgi:hypothetical protein
VVSHHARIFVFRKAKGVPVVRPHVTAKFRDSRKKLGTTAVYARDGGISDRKKGKQRPHLGAKKTHGLGGKGRTSCEENLLYLSYIKACNSCCVLL